MINIGFVAVPLVPIVLRPTGRLAAVHSGPFLFNEVRPLRPSLYLSSKPFPPTQSNAAVDILVSSYQQNKYAISPPPLRPLLLLTYLSSGLHTFYASGGDSRSACFIWLIARTCDEDSRRLTMYTSFPVLPESCTSCRGQRSCVHARVDVYTSFVVDCTPVSLPYIMLQAFQAVASHHVLCAACSTEVGPSILLTTRHLSLSIRG